jgi:hypothetical protein
MNDENGVKTFRELPASYKVLGEVWIDHFYYGKFYH